MSQKRNIFVGLSSEKISSMSSTEAVFFCCFFFFKKNLFPCKDGYIKGFNHLYDWMCAHSQISVMKRWITLKQFNYSFIKTDKDISCFLQTEGRINMGVCSSGVGSVCYYWKVAGLSPLVCMSKCLQARCWTPNCSWFAGLHLAWQSPPSVYECIYELM